MKRPNHQVYAEHPSGVRYFLGVIHSYRTPPLFNLCRKRADFLASISGEPRPEIRHAPKAAPGKLAATMGAWLLVVDRDPAQA